MIDMTEFFEFAKKLTVPDGEVSIEFERRDTKQKLGKIKVRLPDPHLADLKVVYGDQTKTFVIVDDDFQEPMDYLKKLSGQ